MTKKKLPDDVAFPVSVSVLLEKLAVVPQHSEITVQYFYYKGMTARRQQKTKFGRSKRLIPQTAQEIMTASYELSAVRLTTPNAWLEDNSSMNKYTKHRWEVRLRAIPKIELETVRTLLDSEGYAKLAGWFMDANQYAGSIGSHSLVIGFDGKRLTYQQSDRF
jgi:hypothetical protein